jgi:hypothetical protein
LLLEVPQVRFHIALICEPTLLAALGDLTSLAISWRDRDPLRRFWIANRPRFDAFDSVIIPRDFELAKRIVVCATLLCSGFSASPAAQLFIREARRAPLSATVTRTGQRRLRRRVERLERALARAASRNLMEQEIHHVNHALAMLEIVDTSRSSREVWTFEDLMMACCAVGLDGDIGIGRMLPGLASIGAGRPLFTIPYVVSTAQPPEGVYERTVATFGRYTASDANKMFADDAADICRQRTIPTWMTGTELLEAAAFARATARETNDHKDHDGDDWTHETKERVQLIAKLEQFSEWLLIAAKRDNAVLEWITTLG